MNWINKICIGTPQFSGTYGVTKKNNRTKNITYIKNFFKILNKNGINFIDTALDYKKAEKNLHDSDFDFSKFEIMTKIPRPNNEKNYKIKILKRVTKSRNKFKIKKFYSILLHDSFNLSKKDFKEILEVFDLLKKKNLTKYVGFSIYDERQFNNIINNCKPDILQVPANIFDRSFLKKSFLRKIKNNKIKLHVRSIFLQGLLLADIHFIKRKFKRWVSLFHKLEKYCINKNCSKIELTTNFILKFKSIDKIIVGFNDITELEEFLNIKKISLKLPQFTKEDQKYIAKLIKPYNWS